MQEGLFLPGWFPVQRLGRRCDSKGEDWESGPSRTWPEGWAKVVQGSATVVGGLGVVPETRCQNERADSV